MFELLKRVNELTYEWQRNEEETHYSLKHSYPGFATIIDNSKIEKEFEQIGGIFTDITRSYFSNKDIIRMTEKAICVRYDDYDIWIPRSQIIKCNMKIFSIPTWLIFKNM